MTNLVAILHVSRPDWHLAIHWLAWSKWLLSQKGSQPYRLVVLTAKSLEIAPTQRLQAILGDWPDAQIVQNPISDESQQDGYAKLANIAFRAALTCTESLFPGHPTLWVEADCIPIRPSWMLEIDDEYRTRGKPVLGDFHALGPIPHVTGNAVYPPNWRTLLPSIAQLPAPNPPQGWDTLCAHETVPLSARSIRIQQAWDVPPRHFTPRNLSVIHPDTALFHRCKDGSLIDVLSSKLDGPRFTLPPALSKPTPSRTHRLLARQATVH